MDPLALAAIIVSCLTGIVGGIAALLRVRPEARKIKADAGAALVGAATSLVDSQGAELTRLANRIDALEKQSAERDKRETELHRLLDELKGQLDVVTHERDEAFLREGVLKTRVGKLEQELRTIKSPPPDSQEAHA